MVLRFCACLVSVDGFFLGYVYFFVSSSHHREYISFLA
jgi:hypothetical protein